MGVFCNWLFLRKLLAGCINPEIVVCLEAITQGLTLSGLRLSSARSGYKWDGCWVLFLRGFEQFEKDN